jgi:hypothetical protein
VLFWIFLIEAFLQLINPTLPTIHAIARTDAITHDQNCIGMGKCEARKA